MAIFWRIFLHGVKCPSSQSVTKNITLNSKSQECKTFLVKRMRLLFVSAPFRGLTRKLTRFQRVFWHLENGLVFVLHSWIINVNWLQYSLSVWNMMVSSSIAGLCGCQALTQFGGLSPYPTKCGDSCEERCSTIQIESTARVNNTTWPGD